MTLSTKEKLEMLLGIMCDLKLYIAEVNKTRDNLILTIDTRDKTK